MRYLKPSGGTKLFNFVLMLLARLGVSVYGSCTLAVRGRKTGAWQTVPVNVLEHEGARYLVAPRGETQWVRNMRAAGGGELRLGSTREAFRVHEVGDAEKPALLRAYLRRWGFEVKAFFPGLAAESGDEDFRRVARDYPVFRLTAAS
jgi:deazaflavin-dependent oxidoreductase (nitroreductase family)